jgi:hypothetical protein
MSLNDKERFILHLTALLVMEHMGEGSDLKGLPEFIRKNRARKLTTEDTKIITDEIFEEMIFGKTIYEEYESGI